jgi:hypothetical protein
MAAKKVEAKKVAKAKEVEEIVVSQEYFEAHPELEAEGVSVGDTIEVPVMPKETSDKLDLDAETAIIKGSEFIRVYPEGNEENVKSFLSKDSKYVAISPASINRITVSWRESIKSKDADSGRIVDTGKMETKVSVFTEKTHGADWMKKARAMANEAPKRSCVIS